MEANTCEGAGDLASVVILFRNRMKALRRVPEAKEFLDALLAQAKQKAAKPGGRSMSDMEDMHSRLHDAFVRYGIAELWEPSLLSSSGHFQHGQLSSQVSRETCIVTNEQPILKEADCM